MDVRIGEELTGPEADIGVSFAVVAAPYRLNSINVGSLGVIGPMRMPYRAVMPLVRQAADFLSAKLAMNFRKPRLAFDRDIPFKIV